jgi:hypothetical protein
LDCSLKIWDLGAVLAPGQQVPAVGGLHYVVLRAAAANDDGNDRRFYLVTNQGWGASCEITSAILTANSYGQQIPTWKVVGTAAAHSGFVESAAFTADSTRVVTIDTGHGGQYSVCDIPEMCACSALV